MESLISRRRRSPRRARAYSAAFVLAPAIIAAMTFTGVFTIVKVALGLGFVIFVHELGHFLLAKWNGVKVEKFSIGFGPKLFGFTYGETEYVIAALPLGGFVKMLGEAVEDEENKSSDPRAFPNKSVGARISIISAGVVMNLIFGFVFFFYVYRAGWVESSARLGFVTPGSPAYEAGLRAGDEVIGIGGRSEPSFDHLRVRVGMSGSGEALRFTVRRPGVETPLSFDIEPRREARGDFPTIGVLQASGMMLADPPYSAPEGVEGKSPSGLERFDRVVAMGPEGGAIEPVADSATFDRRIAELKEQPVTVVVEHGGIESLEDDGKSKRAPYPRGEATLPPSRVVDFGFRAAIEPISCIQNDSAAKKAGLQLGDRILAVDGRDDFDPLRLPFYCFDHAGKPVVFKVAREVPGHGEQTVEVTATPAPSPPNLSAWRALPGIAIDVTPLGFGYHVRTRVTAIRPGSPAEKAGLKVGDVVRSLKFPKFKEGAEEIPEVTVEFDDEKQNWPLAFAAMQFRPRAQLAITVNGSKTPIEIEPAVEADWFLPQRGLNFMAEYRRLPPQPPLAAIRRGIDETWDNILSVYAMIRGLAQGRVSPNKLGGIISIGAIAYGQASSGLVQLVHFLAMLNINLAVLNFLPIPPIDGGQMVFLIAEKIRGKPLPDAALIIPQYAGLLFVLGLFVFVTYQDIVNVVIPWLTHLFSFMICM